MQAVALAPSHSDAALYLGEHLAMTGRHGAAANYFRKVQELSGDKVGLANLLHSARWLCDFETGNGNRVHVDGSVSELPVPKVSIPQCQSKIGTTEAQVLF